MRWLFFTFSWLLAGSLVATAADRTIILDDGPDGAPAIPLVGSWNWRPESGASEKPNSYLGTGSRFAFVGDGKTATYAPNFTYDGLWEASLWWPTFNWTDNALVQANHSGGTHDQRVNQSVNSGQWNPLGIYPFAEGPAGGSVVISSDGANAGTSNVGPVADAVRFQYLGELLTPNAAFASSTHPQNPDRPPANVINGSGMSDGNGDGIPDTHEANQWGDDISWMAASGDLTGWFAVDLGDPYQLFRADVYNFNANEGGRTDRGVKRADVYVSTADAPTLGDFSDPSIWRLVADDMSFAQASGNNSYNTPDLIDLDGQWARWFALDIQEHHGGTFVGLSEIQVFGVPEPGTLLLCCLGLICLLLPVRRRRRAVRAGLAG